MARSGQNRYSATIVLLPLLLIFIGVLSAAGLAYGGSAYWADYAQGLSIIMLSRQLQWPLVLLSLAAAMGLILLVIAGKRRAWWLIGLAPILALFVHRFSTGPASAMAVLEHPTMIEARDATNLRDDDYVVGASFAGKSIAFPYACLYVAPVVVHQEHDKRMILLWSAAANRAVSRAIDREIKVRELEAVCVAANALLVYNARYGEFINGVTGRTPVDEMPTGFGDSIPTWKMTWARWRQLHPDTLVLSGRSPANSPRAPIAPSRSGASRSTTQPVAPPRRVILVGWDKPVALDADDLDSGPVNLTADGIPVVVWRDSRSGIARAFDRRIEEDMATTFEANTDTRRYAARMIDKDTGCGWNFDGVAVDGDKQLRGRQLRSIPIEEDVYWIAIQRWFPGIEVYASPGSNEPPQ